MKMRSLFMVLALVLLCVQPAMAENLKLRIGVLPALGTMPLRVAVEDGFFAEQGLDVSLIPFKSAMERDTAMSTNNIDGFFGDLVATLLLLKNRIPVRVATVSTRTNPDQVFFGLITSPQSSKLTFDTLAGKTVGISHSTIIEYMLDMMEAKAGVPKDALKRIDIKGIPVRLQMLFAGKIDTAVMPEPLVSFAEFKGGSVLATDSDLDMPLTVICLNRKIIEKDGVRDRFLTAYRKAVAALNEHPQKYRQLLVKACRIPGPLAKEFPMPRYPEPYLPGIEDVEAVADWMRVKGLLSKPIPYNTVVFPAL